MTESERKQIGERLRQRRMAMGMTLKEIAFRAGLSESIISMYETGKSMPKAKNVSALERALGIELSGLAQRIEADRREASIRAGKARNEQRKQKKAKERENKTKEQEKQEPAWMEEARKAAEERRARDARRRSARRPRIQEPETGATSGFVSFAELREMPEFLHDTLIDLHIRRMLFLCGEYVRLADVKKTRTPEGVAWSA